MRVTIRWVMFSMLYLTETRRDGIAFRGDVLFKSETNRVDVKFTSDSSKPNYGINLDVISTPCAPDRQVYLTIGSSAYIKKNIKWKKIVFQKMNFKRILP